MTGPPVKKACDACHRRKVRCTGGQPCKNCGQANLQCTYLAIPQKKGPKGSRAKVISEIRDTQQLRSQQQHHQHHQHHIGPGGPLTSPSLSNHLKNEGSPFDFNSSPLSHTYYSTPGLLSPQTVLSCLSFFFDHLYPTYPILDRVRLHDLVDSQEREPSESYCLIASVCAFTMIQPGMTLSVSGALGESYEGEPPQSRYGFASLLIEDVLRVRKGLDYVEDPSLITVQTSFFLYSSYFTLEKQNSCWYYLREAATLAQMLSMHEEASYAAGDATENVYKRRTFWLLLLTERAYALERHRPLSLHPTIELPTAEGPEQDVISGFLYLIQLFRCLDDEFMGLWNKVKVDCSAGWLSGLQQRLYEALPPNMKTTESQMADIKITQQWLRIMVWQLSIANNALSSNSQNTAMTFKYPIEVAKDLVNDISRLSLASMEVHGVGLVSTLVTGSQSSLRTDRDRLRNYSMLLVL
jgi:Fungal Zn(2)-Cys(6) binuclear cluster domain/Fungal specific transcription factor domain